jgi:ABC-type uncharacterized transport system substrate-binding protein
MRRREFVSSLSSAVVWPFAARAQQSATPVVGYLTALGANDRPNLRDAFRRGLNEAGFIDGRIVTIEYRFAENHYQRLPALAADLVGRKVAVIAATGGGSSVLAAKSATSTIPIAFTSGGDPVKEGFVANLNRPGGNITGVSWFGTLLGAKALGLLHELIPNAKVVAVLVNPKTPETMSTAKDVQEAARPLNKQVLVLEASEPNDIDTAFALLRQQHADALLVSGDSFLSSRRQQILALAARESIPAIYANREFVAEGGLLSFGNDVADGYRRAGIYVGRILGGAPPAELPIDRATRFEFVFNLKTAKALGITVPPTLLARADEVIE